MNLRRLKYFVKIVDIGSLTQAAEVLHIAQPALSQQVATLEGEMDQQLLIRTKRGVTPTEAGKILYTHARTILRQCEQAQLAVNNVGQTLRGQVSIGLAPGTAASAITMPLLQTVRNELPEVMVYLQESSGTALNDKLLAGQLDMAVLYERSPVAGIVSQPLLKEDLYLVGTRDCPGQSVDLTAVAEMNLFLPRDYSAVRARVTEAFTLRRLSAKIIGEIESINPAVVKALQDDAFIPVISPIGVGDDELSYNINADVVAGKMAETLKAEKLVMLTNTPGVLDKEGNLITGLTSQEIDALFADGTISGGMYPKISSALQAARNGVKAVHIIDGRVEHCLLLEILTPQGVGTMIKG